MMRRLALGLLPTLLVASSPARTAAPEDAWSGRWALELRVASVAKLPLLPSQRSVTVSWMLVDLEQGAEGWTQRHRVCDVRVDNSSLGVRMAIPRAFVQALPQRQYAISLRNTPAGWSYTADMGVETIGLEAGYSAARLPRSARDPGVRDTDGDGAPGATVEMFLPVVGKARLFVVQRSHLVLSGRGTNGDGLYGDVEIRAQQQNTVGADPGMFRRSPAIEPDAARSGFTLARVPHRTSCADLRETAMELFRKSP